jgi:hypothetical protein
MEAGLSDRKVLVEGILLVMIQFYTLGSNWDFFYMHETRLKYLPATSPRIALNLLPPSSRIRE